jgi:8-amino-7-oxononanoate synthase
MSIFDKCPLFTTAHELEALGRYAFFRPIEESTTTEAKIEGEWKVMVGSNNYLGLTHHPKVLEAARNALVKYGSGSTGSRLLNGTLDLHYELEGRLARLFRKEAALVFTTGYQASVGAIAQLVGRGEHMFLDKLDHASLVDGARLSDGEMHRYPHGDFISLDKQLSRLPPDTNKLIVSDGVFSMEGSIVDLPELVRIARKHHAQTLIDEAHALGVLGPDGAGTASHYGMLGDVDLILATFSKSLASVGGVIAGRADVIHWLRHFSRALIFTAAMPPSSVAGALAALEVMQDEPERRERLWANTRAVAEGLSAMGFDIGASQTPVIPVLIGSFDQTMRIWRSLFDDGVFSHPIAQPAVPVTACRIRVSMSAEHTPEQIERVLSAFERVAKMTVVEQ